LISLFPFRVGTSCLKAYQSFGENKKLPSGGLVGWKKFQLIAEIFFLSYTPHGSTIIFLSGTTDKFLGEADPKGKNLST
jgi:hypothetical protein